MTIHKASNGQEFDITYRKIGSHSYMLLVDGEDFEGVEKSLVPGTRTQRKFYCPGLEISAPTMTQMKNLLAEAYRQMKELADAARLSYNKKLADAQLVHIPEIDGPEPRSRPYAHLSISDLEREYGIFKAHYGPKDRTVRELKAEIDSRLDRSLDPRHRPLEDFNTVDLIKDYKRLLEKFGPDETVVRQYKQELESRDRDAAAQRLELLDKAAQAATWEGCSDGCVCQFCLMEQAVNESLDFNSFTDYPRS